MISSTIFLIFGERKNAIGKAIIKAKGQACSQIKKNLSVNQTFFNIITHDIKNDIVKAIKKAKSTQ